MSTMVNQRRSAPHWGLFAMIGTLLFGALLLLQGRPVHQDIGLSTRAAAYANHCAAQLDLGRLELALADCDRAAALDPAYAGAYAARARVLVALGDYTAALADLDRAIALQPEARDPYLRRAMIYAAREDNQQAFADVSVYIDLGGALSSGWRDWYERIKAELG